ncbi:MAG: hypothetical protein QM533_03945 [Cytophagales bacterium]|nr:hypothetical protein [Cytophagales bacterium]
MTFPSLQNSMMHLRSSPAPDYSSSLLTPIAKQKVVQSRARKHEPNETTIAAMVDARRIAAQLDAIHLAN